MTSVETLMVDYARQYETLTGRVGLTIGQARRKHELLGYLESMTGVSGRPMATLTAAYAPLDCGPGGTIQKTRRKPMSSSRVRGLVS